MKVPVAGLIRDLVTQAVARVKATSYMAPKAPKPSDLIEARAQEIRDTRKRLSEMEKALNKDGWSVYTYDSQRLWNTSRWEADARHAFDKAQAKRLNTIRDLDTSLRMDMIGKDMPELATMLKEFQTALKGI